MLPEHMKYRTREGSPRARRSRQVFSWCFRTQSFLAPSQYRFCWESSFSDIERRSSSSSSLLKDASKSMMRLVLLVQKGLVFAPDLQETSLLRRNPSSIPVLRTRAVI